LYFVSVQIVVLVNPFLVFYGLNKACDWFTCGQVSDATSAQVCYQLMTRAVSRLVAFIIDSASTVSSAVSSLFVILRTLIYNRLASTVLAIVSLDCIANSSTVHLL